MPNKTILPCNSYVIKPFYKLNGANKAFYRVSNGIKNLLQCNACPMKNNA